MIEWINEVVKLYFNGYTVKQALDLVRDSIEENEMHLVIKNYEGNLRNARNN